MLRNRQFVSQGKEACPSIGLVSKASQRLNLLRSHPYGYSSFSSAARLGHIGIALRPRSIEYDYRLIAQIRKVTNVFLLG